MAGVPERVVCPRCRANSFPGSPRCWQCGGSLPPPDDGCAPAGTSTDRQRLRAAAVLLATVLVVAVGAALARFAWQRGDPGARALNDAYRLRQRLEARTGVGRPVTPGGVDDPVYGAARREIERLYRERGVGEGRRTRLDDSSGR